MAEAGMHRTIPALPVREMVAAVAFYRERFGFEVLRHDGGFAVLRRDEAVLHLWESGDEELALARGLAEKPVCSGAESFIAGTASARIEVADVDGLYEELRAAEVLHPVSRDGVDDTDFGTREFATLDQDGNLLRSSAGSRARRSDGLAGVGVPGPAGLARDEVDAADPVVVRRAAGAAGEHRLALGGDAPGVVGVAGDERVRAPAAAAQTEASPSHGGCSRAATRRTARRRLERPGGERLQDLALEPAQARSRRRATPRAGGP